MIAVERGNVKKVLEQSLAWEDQFVPPHDSDSSGGPSGSPGEAGFRTIEPFLAGNSIETRHSDILRRIAGSLKIGDYA